MDKDTIYREDAIKALLRIDGIKIDKALAMGEIRSVPSANKPQKVIAQITFDEKKLHEIVKEAVERFKEKCEIADRPQGKWIYGEHDIAMCDGYRCDRCGFFVPWDYEHKSIDFINDYSFCPNCGARMREINNE